MQIFSILKYIKYVVLNSSERFTKFIFINTYICIYSEFKLFQLLYQKIHNNNVWGRTNYKYIIPMWRKE